MKGIIVYKSNYGSTREYANWLKEETGFPAIEIKKVKKQNLQEAEVIILGCPIFANRPSIAKWIKKKWSILKSKKLVLYTTSGAKPEDPVLKNGFESSFEPEIKNNIRFFPQGGRMIISKLNPLHRFLMNLGMKIEKDPKVRKAMAEDKDNVNRNGIKPILEYVN